LKRLFQFSKAFLPERYGQVKEGSSTPRVRSSSRKSHQEARRQEEGRPQGKEGRQEGRSQEQEVSRPGFRQT